jgi:hypothetical protein
MSHQEDICLAFFGVSLSRYSLPVNCAGDIVVYRPSVDDEANGRWGTTGVTKAPIIGDDDIATRLADSDFTARTASPVELLGQCSVYADPVGDCPVCCLLMSS